jgi:nucleoid-associated protein YgaU
MGIFDFVKAAGEKLLGIGTKSAVAAPAAGKAIADHVKKQGLGVKEDLEIIWVDGKAKVTGTAKTQADKEKAILAIGNVEGVSQVEEDIKVQEAAPPKESRMYTVKKGDTLSAIAKAMYGKSSKYPVIFEANKPMLSHPDKIYPGQVLRIPDLEDGDGGKKVVA